MASESKGSRLFPIFLILNFQVRDLSEMPGCKAVSASPWASSRPLDGLGRIKLS